MGKSAEAERYPLVASGSEIEKAATFFRGRSASPVFVADLVYQYLFAVCFHSHGHMAFLLDFRYFVEYLYYVLRPALGILLQASQDQVEQ